MKLKFCATRFFLLALLAALLPLMTAAPARAAGAASFQAVQQVFDGDAFDEWYVGFVYSMLLERDATPSERGAARTTFLKGDGWQEVVTQIAGSSAYFQRAGGNNTKFVTQLFQDLVGRPPDAADEAPAALDFLKTDSREDLAAGIADTDEFRSTMALRFYGAWMGNSRVSDAKIDDAAAQLKSGGLTKMASAMLASPEYFNSVGGTQSGWQKAVSATLSDTSGDMTDGDAMPTSMNDNARAPLVKAMMASSEYFAGVVKSAYGKYLHRAPTPAETQKWSGVLKNGGSSEAVMLGVFTSDEYFDRAGGTTDAFLRHLSQDLLGKANGSKIDGTTSSGDLIDLLRNMPHRKKKKSQPQSQPQ